MAMHVVWTENETAQMIDQACKRIAPLWPLKSFIAVNPFLGLSDQPFPEAARVLGRVAPGSVLMEQSYYLDKIRSGAMGKEDVRAALEQRDWQVFPAEPLAWLEAELQQEERAAQLSTLAQWMDDVRRTQWSAFVVDEISKWCSSYFDNGQSLWRMPWAELPLYQAWKRVAAIDANPELAGLTGFRRHAHQLPDDEDEAIAWALRILNVPPELTTDFLHCELLSIAGWSAFAAYQEWCKRGERVVRQLLAIRLAYDAALFSRGRDWRCHYTERNVCGGFSEPRYLAQLALEHAFRGKLCAGLQRVPAVRTKAARKRLQAVFCIDVRSEVYRRALEAQSGQIQTVGFAGFFGLAVAFESAALCPVLLSPRHTLHGVRRPQGWGKFWDGAGAAWRSLAKSASACFSAVEVGGMLHGIWLLKRAAGVVAQGKPVTDLAWEIPLAQRVELVAAALKNMSLDVGSLAPVVLLCGHGSSTQNNPYAASLDCGACGGNKGDVNARVAAALMNDAAVRQQLRKEGMAIPEDTVFVAGLHVTTTDDVVLYDSGLLAAEQRAELESWLRSASCAARRERSVALQVQGDVDAAIRRRSADWAEVRPEWGLAGNAAFIAAPRWRTQGVNLGGRVFLHDYEAAADPDAAVLQLILTAPLVVASWINLQYYGSTVNNPLFGSGNKVLHNVVGKFGVWEGNAGDLRTGLPMQSLHNGKDWVHEPLRLQALIEAPRERIDGILRANVDIKNLVDNEWIHLHAIEGDMIYQRRGAYDWLPLGEA